MLALLQYGPFAPQALPCFIAPMNHSDDSAQPVPWLWFPMARCPSSDRWKSDTGEPSRIFRFLLRHALSSTTPPSSLDASDHCFSKDVRLRHLWKVGHWDLCNEAESSSLSLGLASSLSRGLQPLSPANSTDRSVSRALSPPHAGALLHVEWSINMIHTFQWIGETGHCRCNQRHEVGLVRFLRAFVSSCEDISSYLE
jgi:hypothetical protein